MPPLPLANFSGSLTKSAEVTAVPHETEDKSRDTSVFNCSRLFYQKNMKAEHKKAKPKNRFEKFCDDLTKLADKDATAFEAKFDRCVFRKALRDIERIARSLKSGNTSPDQETIIFRIYDRVDLTLRFCGQKVNALVGAKTRRDVYDECERAVADVYGIPRRLTGRYRRD